MNPLFHTEFSISDSLKNVRKSVLIYETIIDSRCAGWCGCRAACKSIGKSGNESIAGITGEGNEVMKNSEKIVKF